MYGPPQVLSKTNLRKFLGFFLSSLCIPKVFKSILQLIHHFDRMVRQLDSTLLSLTQILRVPKGYLGCFDSNSHRDRHYVSVEMRWLNRQVFLKIKDFWSSNVSLGCH